MRERRLDFDIKFDNKFWLQWTFLPLALPISYRINIYIFNFLKNLISIRQNLASEVYERNIYSLLDASV